MIHSIAIERRLIDGTRPHAYRGDDAPVGHRRYGQTEAI